jgi:flagellar basal body-associated protein FliL
MFDKIKEKVHIIFIVIMIIYLTALGVMTAYTYLKERPYWEKQEKQKMSAQAAGKSNSR